MALSVAVACLPADILDRAAIYMTGCFCWIAFFVYRRNTEMWAPWMNYFAKLSPEQKIQYNAKQCQTNYRHRKVVRTICSGLSLLKSSEVNRPRDLRSANWRIYELDQKSSLIRNAAGQI